MSVTLESTGIRFPDNSIQTTAASSGGSVTTATVLSATAGASAGAVGTYAWLWQTDGTAVTIGGTKAGSSLRYAGFVLGASGTQSTPFSGALVIGNGGTPSGTWRCMGRSLTGSGSYGQTQWGMTLWLRIS